MLLKTDDEKAIELRIAGYQYHEVQEEYDSCWLMIEGIVRHPKGDWRFCEPCLEIYEVAKLADWLEAVAVRSEKEPICGFTEPNLRFEVIVAGSSRVLRVSFSAEARPSWAKTGEDVQIEFPLDRLDIKKAVSSLRAQLKNFPQRAKM